MTATTEARPATYLFHDDGLIPNSRLPLVLYRRAVALGDDPEDAIERLFARHGWVGLWRNGIYDYQHYHPNVHEALGVARGHALVLFGGESGEALQLAGGDVAVLPAGTGHKCVFASHDFRVVGGYPPGEEMQIARPTPDNRRKALETIPRAPLPPADPVFGASGPLMKLWGG